MKFKQYLKEDFFDNGGAPEAFKKLEDRSIAKAYTYLFLTLKKPIGILPTLLKYLKKHLHTPLDNLSYKSGEQGNLAVYSPSMDSVQLNFSMKKLSSPRGVKVTNLQDRLANAKENLKKWEKFQSKAKSPKDVKTGRGGYSKTSSIIIHLEDKIRRGDIPVPYNSFDYAKDSEQVLEMIIVHELGHRYWHKKLGGSDSKIHVFYNQKQFPSEYSKINITEYFAELYSLTKVGLIDKADISNEVKTYMKSLK
jgi:hypothetical protein